VLAVAKLKMRTTGREACTAYVYVNTDHAPKRHDEWPQAARADRAARGAAR
jgi:hypothetical protein